MEARCCLPNACLLRSLCTCTCTSGREADEVQDLSQVHTDTAARAVVRQPSAQAVCLHQRDVETIMNSEDFGKEFENLEAGAAASWEFHPTDMQVSLVSA
jgi:hypothetical protein